jgi:nucleotide-binding universal stress UspA family protein
VTFRQGDPGKKENAVTMHVILAVDGSDASKHAIEVVKQLPFREKPRFTLVTALKESPLDLDTTSDGVSVYEAEKRKALSVLEEVAGDLKEMSAQCEMKVHHSHPGTLILKAAGEAKADLIVLGAFGHNAIYRAVVGSTADYVSNNAKCSVLLARKPFVLGDGWNLVLATDGSAESNTARQQIMAMDWPENTELHVTTVFERPKLVPEAEVYDPPALDKAEQELQQMEGFGDGVAVTCSVHESVHVGSALRDLTVKRKADLLFVGATGKSEVTRLFLGSVSRFLMHHTDCAMWIARQKTWE